MVCILNLSNFFQFLDNFLGPTQNDIGPGLLPEPATSPQPPGPLAVGQASPSTTFKTESAPSMDPLSPQPTYENCKYRF